MGRLHRSVTENRCEAACALCFTEQVRIPDAYTKIPPKSHRGRQRTCNASGVVGVHERLNAYHRLPTIPKKN